MEPQHVAAALLSAVLHAGWNAAVKASARPTEAMAAQMLLGAVLVLPAWSGPVCRWRRRGPGSRPRR